MNCTLMLKMACAACIICFGLPLPAQAQTDAAGTEPHGTRENWPFEVHGFFEIRGGYRTRNDKYEKNISVMESRLDIDLFGQTDWADFKVRGDFFGDLVTEQGDFDLREANIFTRPTDWMDVKIGRQILTWGTGDLVFINDLFAKDWNSFFIGRDTDYLKAPSDAAKVSLFHDVANLDIVYTPQFDPDRYIDGEYVSYWNAALGRHAGQDAIIRDDRPDQWFQDDEIAMRAYKNINNYEFALYGYHGFWKSPAGQPPSGVAIFPDLNVYGASVQGTVGKGIANAEVGYYDSADDRGGKDGYINNSEMRYLIGYTQELAANLTGGIQYYIEQLLQYDDYKKTTSYANRDEYRQLLTVRLTKLLMNQNLRLSVFAYFSPTDRDVYLRPNVHYKISDSLSWEAGSNIFFGDYPYSFFGQFENNTNTYSAIRYSF